MSQAGYTPIQLYYSTTASAVPTNTNLANGELAINITDGKLYYKDNTGTVKVIAGAGGAGVAGGSNAQVQYNSSGSLAGSANLTFDGTSLTLGGNPTLSGGTANGVTYLNGSKVLTSGSALVFDGTNLGIGASSPAVKLDIAGYSSANTDAEIQISRTSSSTGIGQGPGIRFNDGTTNNTRIIQNGSGNLQFWHYNGSWQTEMTLDSSGNLGLGVTPSAWGASWKSASINTVGALASTTGVTRLYHNAYNNDSNNIYRTTASASMYSQDGAHSWFVAPSGTAGNAISFTQAMTLDASGNLGVGTTSAGTRLHAVGGNVWSSNFYEVGRFQKSSGTGVSLGYDNTAYVATIGAYSHDGTASNLSFWTYPGSGIAQERARIDSSGNMGLGVTPTSIQSGYKGFQIGATVGGGIVSAGTDTYFTNNAYVTGGSWYFGSTGYAMYYNQSGGVHSWATSSASGSGGGVATMTERFRIAADGAWGLSGANYGSSGQVLTSQGSGSPPIWASGGGGGGSPGGSNTQVQYNSSGSFAGSANFTFNGTGVTAGFFAPSSTSVPATGISLPSSNTLGFSSASQGNAMFFRTFQNGSSSAYTNQLSIGTSPNTSYYSNLYVYAVTTAASEAKASDGPGQIYSQNGNVAYRSSQVVEAATSGFTSNQYVPVGIESVSRSSGGWQPTQFPTGSFQVMTNIGVYGEAQGSSGYPLGTGFYAMVGSYYANATGYYARTYSIAPTSGSSFCYRADIGPHVFGGNMIGYNSRVVSGQGGNSTYSQTIGWWHMDETANGVGGTAARFDKAGNTVGTITMTSSATSYNTSSDPRQKDITGPITADEAKTFVMALQPKQGTWKADGMRFLGFLSTDYELVDPSAVSGVAGATEVIGNLLDKDGNVVNTGVVEPTPDALPEGGSWVRTGVKDIYQTLEYGSAAWCANMTAHAQYLQSTIDQLISRISALENK